MKKTPPRLEAAINQVQGAFESLITWSGFIVLSWQCGQYWPLTVCLVLVWLSNVACRNWMTHGLLSSDELDENR